MDRSSWRVLTKCGPLEMGMATTWCSCLENPMKSKKRHLCSSQIFDENREIILRAYFYKVSATQRVVSKDLDKILT